MRTLDTYEGRARDERSEADRNDLDDLDEAHERRKLEKAAWTGGRFTCGRAGDEAEGRAVRVSASSSTAFQRSPANKRAGSRNPTRVSAA